MMLHRHFDKDRNENMTTLADVYEGKKEIPVPSEEKEEAPKRRSKVKKSE